MEPGTAHTPKANGTAELCGSTGKARPGHAFEDGVSVGAECNEYAMALYQDSHQQEVVAGVLLFLSSLEPSGGACGHLFRNSQAWDLTFTGRAIDA